MRPQQTAAHFFGEVKQAGLEAKTSPFITFSGKELGIFLWLNDQQYNSMLLITHQPFTHQLVDLLADEPLPASFAMTTAAMASIDETLLATTC